MTLIYIYHVIMISHNLFKLPIYWGITWGAFPAAPLPWKGLLKNKLKKTKKKQFNKFTIHAPWPHLHIVTIVPHHDRLSISFVNMFLHRLYLPILVLVLWSTLMNSFALNFFPSYFSKFPSRLTCQVLLHKLRNPLKYIKIPLIYKKEFNIILHPSLGPHFL